MMVPPLPYPYESDLLEQGDHTGLLYVCSAAVLVRWYDTEQ
jgi:hypothetical protein